MRAPRGPFGNERGMILFVCLTVLSLLVSVGLGVIVSTQTDSKITANLRGATETFYVAEAGLAWAKERLSSLATNPPAPPDSTQSFSVGSFAVSFLSPSKVSALVGRVVVRSAGLGRASSQVVQARLTKTYDLIDGALSLKGNNRVRFSGNSFVVSGLDHDPVNGNVVLGSKPLPGIAVSNEFSLGEVRDGLSIQQGANITGGTPSGSALSVSEYLPSSAVTKIAEELCTDSHTMRQAMPVEGSLSLNGITWGNRLTPQIRCIDGVSEPGDSLALSGSSAGAGILIVRNADLVVSGAFHWEGLIVVTGENVGFRVADNEVKEIYGSVIINESNPAIASGRLTLDLDGTVKLLNSRAALARAAALIPAPLLDSVYSFLPTTITQDYWRALTP